MFHLHKWYLDLVTEEGAVVIVYAARLRWGPLGATVASIVHSAPDQPLEEASTALHADVIPEAKGDLIAWAASALDATGTWDRRAAAISCVLHRSAAGEIRWQCEMPRADATLRWGSRTWRGTGYAEWLNVTVPPAQLPFRAIRWGRHHSPGHTVVWIEWDGRDDRRWIWLDGRRQPEGQVAMEGITGLDTGEHLTLEGARPVYHREVLGSIARLLPRFAERVTGPLARMRDHKFVAQSRLRRPGGMTEAGWSVFEEVAP